MKRAAILASLLLATGCGKSDDDPGPGGVTVGEARALDEAAQMIDARRMPDDALKAPPSPIPTAPAT